MVLSFFKMYSVSLDPSKRVNKLSLQGYNILFRVSREISILSCLVITKKSSVHFMDIYHEQDTANKNWQGKEIEYKFCVVVKG